MKAQCRKLFSVFGKFKASIKRDETETLTKKCIGNLNFLQTYLFHRPIDDIDLPEELPDFLKPKPSTPRPARPIQDIDLPDGASIIQPDESEIEPEKQEEEGEISQSLSIYLDRISKFDYNSLCLTPEIELS